MSILAVLWLVGITVVFLFSFVIIFGAPFLPTLKARTDDAFGLLGLKPGQTLLELGSGDGRILKEAARRGIKSIGYELNPLLVFYSRVSTLRYRKLVKIKLGNYWHHKLPDADGIYVFLLNPYMTKLDKKIIQEFSSGVRLVSFAFEIPGKKPVKEKGGLRLYLYRGVASKSRLS